MYTGKPIYFSAIAMHNRKDLVLSCKTLFTAERVTDSLLAIDLCVIPFPIKINFLCNGFIGTPLRLIFYTLIGIRVHSKNVFVKREVYVQG